MENGPDTGPWERAGLYDPDEPDADERLALLQYLSDRGATIDQMVEAHAQGSLPAVASDLVVRGENELVPGQGGGGPQRHLARACPPGAVGRRHSRSSPTPRFRQRSSTSWPRSSRDPN